MMRRIVTLVLGFGLMLPLMACYHPYDRGPGYHHSHHHHDRGGPYMGGGGGYSPR